MRRFAGLGDKQIRMLRSLEQYGPWPGTGWSWTTPSQTLNILRSLVRRGLASYGEDHQYEINDNGLQLLRRLPEGTET